MKKLRMWAWTNRKPLWDFFLLLTVAVVAFAGKVEDAVCIALLALAAQNSDLGSKVEQHTAQLAQVLGDLAKAGVSVTVHNYGGAQKGLARSVVDGARLAQLIQAEKEGNTNDVH